ncbi:MAG: CBS domain-containing protein [Candidatus Ratteibacteria bacterium]|nr:CBS domain-containing protein [Candidatus Ratteibacteria bacterium]
MEVKEIMTKDINYISPETNAYEALKMLQKMQISGLPVIDDNNKLMGMFTEKEALAAILPSYIEKVGRFVYRENPKASKQKLSAFRNAKVKDFMRCEVVTVDEDTNLYEAARIMLTQKIRRIPVINKDNVVVGVVSRGDIVKALFEEQI